jgi:hypothetical protein
VQDILAKDTVWNQDYTRMEINAARAHVNGFNIHPEQYNSWLGKVWLYK